MRTTKDWIGFVFRVLAYGITFWAIALGILLFIFPPEAKGQNNILRPTALESITTMKPESIIYVRGWASPVIDGNTFEATAGVWPGMYAEGTFRARGISVPRFDEGCKEAELKAFSAHRQAEIMLIGWPVHLRNIQPDIKNGILVADVYVEYENQVIVDFADAMVQAGYAKPDINGERQGWCG